MKSDLTIWMNMKSHHQVGFLDELSQCYEINVVYYSGIDDRRVNQGWLEIELEKYEVEVISYWGTIKHLLKHKNSIHVIPSYGSVKTLVLSILSSALRIKWCHWSEAERHSSKNFLKRIVKWGYVWLINRFSLCAYGVGKKACDNFVDWGVDEKKVYCLTYSKVVPSTFDSELAPAAYIKTNFLKVIFVGELCLRKGIDILCEAARELEEDDVEFIFIGNDSTSGEVPSKIRSLTNSKYLGVRTPKVVESYMLQADVLVMPSRFDGWGMVSHEAVALGVPVICSDQSGVAGEIVRHEVNGIILNENTTGELVSALRRFKCQTFRNKMKSECVEVAGMYTPKKNVERLCKPLKI